MSTYAQEVFVDNRGYNLNTNDMVAEVAYYTENKPYSNIIIPETVTYENKTYTVTSIGKMDPEYSEGHALSPFSYCKLFTLTLPKTFKYIDSVALQVQSLGAIKCMGDEPPAATSDIGIYDIVRLYVPEGAKSKYMEAKYWSIFKDCREFSQDNSVIENPLKWIVLEDFKDYPFIICDINNSAMMSENIYYGQGYGGNLVVPETITYEDKIYDVKKMLKHHFF